jgi:imidazolonepropionase-like amidohydrolase
MAARPGGLRVSPATILRAPRVFNGERLLDRPHEVHVEDGLITAVVPARDPGGDVSAHFDGATILPGLVDAHVHLSFDASPDIAARVRSDAPATAALRSALNARRHLAAGITTVRDLGSRDGIVVDIARAVGTPLLPVAPRILAAGQVLTITGGHGFFMGRELDGPEAFRQGARAEIKNGARTIKVMATGGVITEQGTPGAAAMTPLELAAAVEEAHKAGLRVAAHAHGTEGIKNAIRAGVDTIEHVSYLDDEAIELFLESEAWMVSTLIASERLMPHLDDPAMPAHVRDKIRDHTSREAASLERAIEAGVRVAAGTDAGTGYNPHGGLPEQVALLGRHGMTPEQALTAATRDAARSIGVGQTSGWLEVGRRADLLVVDGNPLADLTALANVRALYLEGRAVKATEMEA